MVGKEKLEILHLPVVCPVVSRGPVALLSAGHHIPRVCLEAGLNERVGVQELWEFRTVAQEARVISERWILPQFVGNPGMNGEELLETLHLLTRSRAVPVDRLRAKFRQPQHKEHNG